MPKKAIETEKKLEVEKEHKKLSKEEYEKKVIEFAKNGLTSEKIGEKLRSEEIHSQEHGKISKILKENKIYTEPDVKNVKKKLEDLENHYNKNKQDKKALKEREKIFGNLRKLKKYYEKKQ